MRALAREQRLELWFTVLETAALAAKLHSQLERKAGRRSRVFGLEGQGISSLPFPHFGSVGED